MPAPRLRRALRAAALAAAAALALGLGGGGLLWAALPDPAPLATRNPPTTALIEQRRAEATRAGRRFRPQQTWVPLERISRRLVEAVVASEDAKFFDHRGFDWAALRDAAGHDLRRGRFARGASTITQQLAKNLWLGTEKSLLRKGKEAVLAAKLERALDKRRILALYLNVAEWGDGTFGVEAGARRHLGVSAAGLDTAQAVLLACMLPAPRRVDLARPAPWLRARATRLLDRLRAEHQIGEEEHRVARASLARLLGLPAPADERAEPPEEEAPTAPAPEVRPEEAPSPRPAPPPGGGAGAEPGDPSPTSEGGAAAPAEPSDAAVQGRGRAQDEPRAGGAPSSGEPTPDATSAPPAPHGAGGPGTGGQTEGSPKSQPAGSPQE